MKIQFYYKLGVVGKNVKFFGPDVATLNIADRATVANTYPEFSATKYTTFPYGQTRGAQTDRRKFYKSLFSVLYIKNKGLQ